MHLLRRHWLIGLLLSFLLFLRLPNFFEPAWYGDEGIYLTLGTAMRHGERLYADIIDHKTPIIYYIAMVPNQFWFRVVNVGASVISVICFFGLAFQLTRSKTATGIATAVFICLTALPWLEGPIPNGELFVMFFILIGARLLLGSPLIQDYLDLPKQPSSPWWLLVAGCLFGLGILTKVPGLFDVAGWLVIYWLAFCDLLRTEKKSQLVKQIVPLFKQLGVVGLGVMTPILLSIIYFIARGAGKAYLDYGLLYNFHYAGTWVPTFSPAWVGVFFTLPVKAAIMALFLLLLSLGSRWWSPKWRFLSSWFVLALFASLLSNRPYPHYFLQIIPSVCLLLGLAVSSWRTRLRLQEWLGSLVLVSLLVATLQLLHVGYYSTTTYYLRFFHLMTGQLSPEAYRNSFNWLNADNDKAAAILRTSADKKIFIWGTNPMLYALSGKSPTGRFTVAFHIADFKAYDETFHDVVTAEPEYIVMMIGEHAFPDLEKYVHQYYLPNTQFEHFVLWKRSAAMGIIKP